MGHPAVAAALQEVGETNDVGLHVSHGVFQAVAHPGLGRHVHHMGELVVGEQRFHVLAIREVDLEEGELVVALKNFQAVLFKGHGIIIIEIVQTDNGMSHLEKTLAEMEADESGSACDQKFHENAFVQSSWIAFRCCFVKIYCWYLSESHLVKAGCHGPWKIEVRRVAASIVSSSSLIRDKTSKEET